MLKTFFCISVDATAFPLLHSQFPLPGLSMLFWESHVFPHMGIVPPPSSNVLLHSAGMQLLSLKSELGQDVDDPSLCTTGEWPSASPQLFPVQLREQPTHSKLLQQLDSASWTNFSGLQTAKNLPGYNWCIILHLGGEDEMRQCCSKHLCYEQDPVELWNHLDWKGW